MPRISRFTWVLPLVAAGSLRSQDALSLRDAVALGLRDNPAMAASRAALKAADAGTGIARSSLLPKVNYIESLTRSDNPVFVFGSLLEQHQFTQQNFDLGSLNRPGFLNNFQSAVTVDQPIYDAGKTRLAEKSAAARKSISVEEDRRARMTVMAAVARAYWRALLAKASGDAAEVSLRSAEEDVARAERIRDAGMATDADVLSTRVRLAAVREERIERGEQSVVAEAALNDALGMALDTPHRLTTQLTALSSLAASPGDGAAQMRPEAKELRLTSELDRLRQQAARANYRPELLAHAGFEADRQTFATRGGANWSFGISLRWNIFNGFADRGETALLGYQIAQSRAEERRLDSSIELEVKQAAAALRAAGERIEVTKTAVSEAEEALRIAQNRYEAGMGNIADVLRLEAAVSDTRTRKLQAIYDQRVAATMLELATGGLAPDSGVLNQ